MKKKPEWVKTFRDALKAHCPGWIVMNDRGRMRLQYGQKPNVKSISLPYQWVEEEWIDAFNRCQAAAKALRLSKNKIDIKTAFRMADMVSSKTELDWPEAIKKYKTFKSHRVKEATWNSKYLPVLKEMLHALNSRRPPADGIKLCDLALKKWKKGTSQRRHMRLAIYGLLNFCVQRQDFPSVWLPPAMSDDEVVTTTKRKGYPLTDSQIIRLLDSLPEDETGDKWRFAIQLMAVFGLRPEDLRHIHTRNQGSELWSKYEKSKGGKKGLKTEPRQLFPLWVLDSDGKPCEWNYSLMKRVAIKEALPSLGSSDGKAGEAIGTYLRRDKKNNVWNILRKEVEQEGQQLTPYSFRHRFAYEGHNRKQADGSHRSPKQIADALGHTLDVHMTSYANFMTRELAKAFDSQPIAA